MLTLLLGAGLALVLVPLVVLRRRRAGSVLPAVRAIPAPLPWERAYWRGAPKDGGRRG